MTDAERWASWTAAGGAWGCVVPATHGGLALMPHESMPPEEALSRTREMGVPTGWLSVSEISAVVGAEQAIVAAREKQTEALATIAVRFALAEAGKR